MNDLTDQSACLTHANLVADDLSRPGQNLIYIIDDEPVMTRLIAHYFAQEGYRNVRQLNEAVEIMEALKSCPPDLLVMDLAMPDISGRFLMHMIESDPNFKCVPIIVVSAAQESGVADEILKAGAMEFMAKPVDPVALMDKVKRAFSKKQQLDGWEERTQAARAKLKAIRKRLCQSQETRLRETIRSTVK